MPDFFQNVLTASFHGSIVILAVLVLRLILRKAPKKFICWLWTLAGLRLLMPIPLQSPFSLQPQSIAIPISVNLSKILPIAWAAVAVIIGSYSFASYFHLRKQVDDAVKIPGGWESDKIETAFVLGFLKPKIYIPVGMSGATREQILAHERTHLDKGDHWIKMIGFLALTLHWFNPLVWASYILLCKDMEMACDERVVQFMELEERKAYSAALLRCSTNRAHYAACPVAFGEVSVKYRIKSVLNYRKPSFWVSLLCILAIAFVAVCLMTSPETVVEVPVDPDVPLQEISREDPANFTPAVLPEMEPNPDWGINIILDATSPTGGKLVYAVEERFIEAGADQYSPKNSSFERWNGTCWEPLSSLSGDTRIVPEWGYGFAAHRDFAVNYDTQDLDWSLTYGPLPAGDYRLTQTIQCALGTEIFHTAFHIYREELPSQEEAALTRCKDALQTLVYSQGYAVTLSETDLNGNVTPVKQIAYGNGNYRVEHYLGQFTTASAAESEMPMSVAGWDEPFKLNQNRRFLFPEGKSVISQEEITFCSAWADYKGTAYQGRDTFLFNEDGSLKSVERLTQTMDDKGNVVSQNTIRLDAESLYKYASLGDVSEYKYEDSFETQDNSPWKIFFRVDDDLLSPKAGEVWLGVDAIGVSNYSTDGKYWLEKKVAGRVGPKEWKRLGEEDKEASWGDGTIQLGSRTTVVNVDWTKDYGSLEPGVYRMGKHFYKGEESIIQYAEFAIYQTGGLFGEGAEEAVARADAAMDKLQSGSYRVEKWESDYSPYGDREVMTEVNWKYGDAWVTDYYNKVEQYSHSVVQYPEQDGSFHLNWWERNWYPSEYDSVYFGEGRSVISDREITFAQGYRQDTSSNPCTFYSYFFDENGNLTEYRTASSELKHRYTRYIVTETPEEEIKSWVETKEIEQKESLKIANPGS